jgi:signal transduction histidine kinase
MALLSLTRDSMGSLAVQPNSARAYVLAAALLLLAVAAQWSLRPAVGNGVPFLFFFPAVGIAAMFGGWKPSLVVLAGGALSALYWLEPSGSLRVEDPASRLAIAGYLLGAGLLVWMGGHVSHLRARAVAAENHLQQQVKDLETLLAERDTAQRDALDLSRRLDVALETSAVPFCLLQPLHDAEGNVSTFRWEYLNAAAARLLRRPAAEVVGRPLRESVGSARLEPGLLERVLTALRQRSTVQFETWVEGAAGRRWFHVIASPYDHGLAVWFADITQRKRDEQALRDADRRKDEFLATLAHELRNPLAPIRQAALIGKAPAATEAQKRWSAEVIERQVSHMARLLDDLLDVSRITRGKLELRREPMPLSRAIEAAVEAARPLVDARGQSLAVRRQVDEPWVDADPIRLSQVLSNLLTNASKYTPEGGRIELWIESEAGRARVAVRDNGVGIAPEAIDRIFEMFTQVRGTDPGTHAGLGIGLALSRGLVELHGGQLTAHSEGPGRGSTFVVEMPRCQPPARTAQAAPAAAGRRTRRVLVADDNRDAAQTLADLLRMEGHDVTVAFDGTDALAQYIRLSPEVALLDIGMPGLTGNEVASAIRARPEGTGTLLVAITGWGQERDRDQARGAGFDLHLTKPVDPAQVLQLLGAAPEAR